MNSHTDYNRKAAEDIVNNKFPSYIKMLETCFDFKRWGFRMIFSDDVPSSNPSIAYESKKCRVRFMWEIPDIRDTTEESYILYGRLHAPIDQDIIVWKGEKCYCWHDVKQVLNFLDGLSPQEAFKNFNAPIFMYEFYEKHKNKGWRRSEFQARRQAAVWERYGQRLFDLFDVHHSSLWQEYIDFLKEFYGFGQAPSEHPVRPPLYKVC